MKQLFLFITIFLLVLLPSLADDADYHAQLDAALEFGSFSEDACWYALDEYSSSQNHNGLTPEQAYYFALGCAHGYDIGYMFGHEDGYDAGIEDGRDFF